MAILEREFYRSARGPAPADIDIWSLVFEPNAARLLVCREWRATRHTGVDEFEVAEFLAQEGAPRDALLELLFGESADGAETRPDDQLASELSR
jgi:hypothetical protein